MFLTLMYHIVDPHLVHGMSVHPRAFEAQLQILSDLDVTFLTLADADQILDAGAAPHRGVLLTFDDGDRSVIVEALPLLEAYGAQATMALCGSYISKQTRPVSTIHASQNFAEIHEIDTWLASGRDIAGHTYSHPKLTRIPADEITAEVVRDREVLQAAFGRSLTSFVYPFGSFDAQVRGIVGRFYRNAFTDSRGSWPTPSDRFAVRRLQVRPEWSAVDFRLQVERALCDSVTPPRVALRG